jgi:hypothetical protein
VDPFLAVPGAYEAAEKAIKAGELDLLVTHITIDELAAIPASPADRTCSCL